MRFGKKKAKKKADKKKALKICIAVFFVCMLISCVGMLGESQEQDTVDTVVVAEELDSVSNDVIVEDDLKGSDEEYYEYEIYEDEVYEEVVYEEIVYVDVEDVAAVNVENTTTVSSGVSIPSYTGNPYVIINNNVPLFMDDSYSVSFETYSDLDSLGRCGEALAVIGLDLMPTEDRGSISSVTPTGWVNNSYDVVSGGYVYNRCHLIGWQLSGEDANKYNLITGTRYMNVTGMLPFENMIADYVKETGNHVYFRVIPLFEGDNLLASGVFMEAQSIEDSGAGVLFNVFCYNVQPYIDIDYLTGDNALMDTEYIQSDNLVFDIGSLGVYNVAEAVVEEVIKEVEEVEVIEVIEEVEEVEVIEEVVAESSITYVLNTSSFKFHLKGCSSEKTISDENRQEVSQDRDVLISQGYSPCGRCNP